MGAYGNICEHMRALGGTQGTHGNLWELMVAYGNILERTGAYGCIWERVEAYAVSIKAVPSIRLLVFVFIFFCRDFVPSIQLRIWEFKFFVPSIPLRNWFCFFCLYDPTM